MYQPLFLQQRDGAYEVVVQLHDRLWRQCEPRGRIDVETGDLRRSRFVHARDAQLDAQHVIRKRDRSDLIREYLHHFWSINKCGFHLHLEKSLRNEAGEIAGRNGARTPEAATELEELRGSPPVRTEEPSSDQYVGARSVISDPRQRDSYRQEARQGPLVVPYVRADVFRY
jgi:hypothetical protein